MCSIRVSRPRMSSGVLLRVCRTDDCRLDEPYLAAYEYVSPGTAEIRFVDHVGQAFLPTAYACCQQWNETCHSNMRNGTAKV